MFDGDHIGSRFIQVLPKGLITCAVCLDKKYVDFMEETSENDMEIP